MTRTICTFLFGLLLTCTTYGGTAEPPLLRDSSGQEITTKEAWITRRQEIRELFRTRVYGRVPKTPFKLTSKMMKQDKKAMDGRATPKIVAIAHKFGRAFYYSFQLILEATSTYCALDTAG